MNSNNRSTFTAIILCIVFYLGYTKYLESKYPNLRQKRQTVATETPQESPEAKPDEHAASQNPESLPASDNGHAQKTNIQKLPAEQLILKNQNLQIQFEQDLSAIRSVKALKYALNQAADSPKVELLDYPLSIQGLVGEPTEKFSDYSGRREGDKVIFWRDDPLGWRIEQSFSLLPDSYELQVETRFINQSDKALPLISRLAVDEAIVPIEGGGFFMPSAMYEPKHWSAFIAHVGGSAERFNTQKYCKPNKYDQETEIVDEQQNEQIKFFGLESRYFLKVFMPESKRFTYKMSRMANSEKNGCELDVLATLDQGVIQPGQMADIRMKAFFGPKDLPILEKVDPDLKSGVNLGWFSIIAYPLLSLLNVFYSLTKNYGWAIIIVTILLKIVFYPLTKQAAISANEMKKIQPEMKKLQEKYKDDRQKMQLELMNLYKIHKVNPAKSCLPILPTIPVFIAFYNVLMYAFALRQAPFGLWIHDLSAADPYYITPLLLGVFMLIQMKLTPNVGMDKTQQRIMMMMPVIFTFAMVSLPAGLVLYMLTNSILTIIQQQWLNRKIARM